MEEHYFVKLENHNTLKLKNENGVLKVVEEIPPVGDYNYNFFPVFVMVIILAIFDFIFRHHKRIELNDNNETIPLL